MNPTPSRILLVEDNPGDARLLRELLREGGAGDFHLTHVERLAEACDRVAREGADAILLDLTLPDARGMETVTRMLEAAGEAPIVVLTGLDDESVALQAVHAGAQDYLVKGTVDSALLVRSIRYALERRRLEMERRHLLEREREARTAAESAVRDRDEVLRVVAHDLGNSLAAMLVTTSVLDRLLPDTPDGTAHRTRRMVGNIRTLAEQMQRLRADLLDVARIEAGRLPLELEPASPAALLDACAERFGALAAEGGVALEVGAANPLPAIRADEGRLFQVLANLISNALKFTPAGGRILLGAGPGEEGGRAAVRIQVRDDGAGIPAASIPHLFDRFWTTRQGGAGGAGLGLAIARGIVEAHGGTIEVESREGEGSTFSFTVPAD